MSEVKNDESSNFTSNSFKDLSQNIPPVPVVGTAPMIKTMMVKSTPTTLMFHQRLGYAKTMVMELPLIPLTLVEQSKSPAKIKYHRHNDPYTKDLEILSSSPLARSAPTPADQQWGGRVAPPADASGECNKSELSVESH